MGRAAGLTFLLLAIVATICGAQTTYSPTAANAPASGLALRPAGRLSEPLPTTIDLLVSDRKGRPVTDLKPADIIATEGGHPVQLTSLRALQGAQMRDRLVAFVFGQLDAGAAKSARAIALSTLKSFPDHGYLYAVLGVDGRLRLFADYTAERGDVREAIEALTAASPIARQTRSMLREKQLLAASQAQGSPLSDGEQARAATVLAALEQSQHLVLDRHVVPDIAGLTALCAAQQRLPGRKALLYFGQSTQVDGNTLDQFRAASRAASQSGVSIYAVDMNGLDYGASEAMVASMSMGGAISSANQNHAPAVNGPSSGTHSLLGAAGTKAMTDTMNNIEIENAGGAENVLANLVAQTGGRYTTYTSGIKKWTRQLLGDLDHAYQATYISAAEQPGASSLVTIKPLRRNLVIHASSGYQPAPHPQQAPASLLDTALLGIFEHPETAGHLAYRATALRSPEAAAGGVTEIVVEVPIASLDVREDPNSDLYAYHVKIAARIEQPDGTVVKEFSEDMHHRGGLDTLDSDRKRAVAFQRRALLPDGEYRLVTALVDANAEASGTQTVPFHVLHADTAHSTQSKATEGAHVEADSGSGVAATDPEPAGALLAELDGMALAEPSPLLHTEHTPSPELRAQWIAAARKRALNYQGKLPNFMCLETIDRLTDRAGKGHWTRRDTISELLTYREKKETRTVLAIDGKRSDAESTSLHGPRSNGEYGGLLDVVFDPAVEATFSWQGETQSGGTLLQVFRYQVAQDKSKFGLTDSSLWSVNAAIHGSVSIEPATGAVRSITVEAEGLPAKFSIHASSISVDYDYVAINRHDYLVPVRGAVTLQEGRHEAELNRLQFRDYHRFASSSRIVSYQPVGDAQ